MKSKVKRPEGIIMGMHNGEVLFLPSNTKIANRNCFVVGGPGSFKTQAFVINNILYESECSIVCTDPKGECYEQTSEIKRAQGYDVYVVNFEDMLHSCHYNSFDYVRKDKDAAKVANTIVASKNDTKHKDIWYLSQASLLKSLILYSVYEMPVAQRNINGVLDFLQEHNPEEDETGLSELDTKFLELPPKHPARRSYELGFAKSKEKTRASIIISLLTTLSDFVDEEVGNFCNESDFILSEVGERKMIVYVIMDIMDPTWEGLINLFFSQMFQELFALGKKNHAKLPQPVIFYLDEFPNLGKFELYEEFLATCRGYRISCNTLIQNITQLYDKYGKDKAESMIGNCAIKICMGNVNKTSAEYFSALAGKTTVRIDTQSNSTSSGKQKSSSKSDSYSYAQRNLINVDEIETMDESQCLCFIAHKHPVKLKKAIQFKIFPGITEKYIVYQGEYERKMSEKAKEHQEELKNARREAV